MLKNCLVTVGSTKFDDLIQEVLKPDVLAQLKQHGVRNLIIQCGAGKIFEEISAKNGRETEKKGDGDNEIERILEKTDKIRWTEDGIEITMIRYVHDLIPLIQHSNIVIAHGGAGTIFETTKAKKTMFVVINRSLMSDHQTELARELAKTKDLHYVSQPSELLEALRQQDIVIVPNVPPPSGTQRKEFVQDLFLKCGFIKN
ncbi:unnamed protein product [Bursaphelenchus okinawaensis]|uniref:UDP-N-acetylglucosamine transferase subunit ALG13 n=1 Tax=Bursaphelenchus okinawaensis TaxID=465554 RepID=A0A811KRG5_9BILA|nr:unnamed protein product [Bursaphelenchus okinawaensis]CAG9109886.1 unnamed protein product [Bursaphelenchus okinawaensis]